MYIIQRTKTYANGQTDVSYFKSYHLFIEFCGTPDEAMKFDSMKEAKTFARALGKGCKVIKV